ncbi:MAG: hypothetical protein D6736_21495 [Nitrospinota bacterium]|nr:MAG: hypothetical protein D6736_21495 [Nitrospinota bacterium]
MKQGRVLVFGIDGATFDLILPAIRRGKLPHLAALMDEGSWGCLQSTIPPVTPMAWTSFATGTNAGKHGIFDFSRMEGNRVRLSTAKDRKVPALWTLLSQVGRASIVLNVPFTYPPEEIQGIMIPGFDAPRVDRTVFHPESIYDELSERFGEYRFDWTFPIGKKFDLEAYLSQVKATISHRADTSLYLLQTHPWDFFMVVFSSTDHVQHIFWQYPEGRAIIEETYALVDQHLGRFLEAISEEVTVMVMSDHGAGPIRRLVYLDNWLAREGFLHRPRFTLRQKLLKRSRASLRRLLPIHLRKRLRDRFSGLKGRLEGVEQASAIDWERTLAYSYGMYGNIYINRKGQTPRGIVEPQDYEAVREEIITRLYALKDPESGEPVVERVYRREELYTGPCIDLAPDLVVQWRDYAYFTKRGIDQGEEVFGTELMVEASEYPHTGTHRLEGVFIARGPRIRQQQNLQARIIDLAPTILQILGEPLPSYMDGRVLQEIFDQTFPSSLPSGEKKDKEEQAFPETKEGVALSEEEEATLYERLRSLGYID